MSETDLESDRPPILVRVEPPVGWLILNRPERRNAMNRATWDAIPSRIAELEAHPEVRAIVLRGAGDEAFGAGADIHEFDVQRRDPATAQAYSDANDLAFRAVRECSRPTVAMIRGFCVGGGCALALCADLRVGADDARMAITPARLGLGYSFTGVEHVVRELGPAVARRVFLTATLFPAQEALRMGMLHEVHAAAELEARTLDLARTLAENAPLALRSIKECVLEALRDPGDRDPARVARFIDACFESEDYREGLAAFRERRRPRFVGR